MKELIKYMAEALVDKPEMVSVSEIIGEQTTVIELRIWERSSASRAEQPRR
jgi:predicted RNA-binding protein YlqC (UPF0109 family)